MPSPGPTNSSEKGDNSLFVGDLTSHQGAILGYLNTLLPGDPEVADIAQRTSITLWEKRHEFKSFCFRKPHMDGASDSH